MNKFVNRSAVTPRRNKLAIRSETLAVLTAAQLNRVASGEQPMSETSCPCVTADIVCDTSVSTATH
jgi:hypothetical protein